MENLILLKPSIEYEKEILEYKNSFGEKELIDGGCFLEKFTTIKEWLEFLKKLENKETCSKDFVTSTEYMLFRKSDKKVLGLINFRHYLNEYLENFGGHIGYSITKNERGKNYGKKQLVLCLEEVKKFGLQKVLLTCDKNNIASKKIIESVGGIFEKEIEKEKGKFILKYWINL